MNQQHMHGAPVGCVPFPDPCLPYDAKRAGLHAWIKGQMAVAAEAFGAAGWPALREWFLWLLIEEARARLAAHGALLAGWPCEVDLRELGREPRGAEAATLLPLSKRRGRAQS